MPGHRDPLATLAALIVDRHRDSLPDLSRCTVLLPNLLPAPRLRRLLLDSAAALGHHALLGPVVTTVRQWLDEVVPPPAAPLSPQARELLLVETLYRHRRLFKESDPWLLAANLLELFDQLTLHRIDLPADLAEFTRRLGGAYQLTTPAPEALSEEAGLVHTLWHAWHRQLHEEARLDPQMVYLRQLEQSLAALDESQHLYMAGQTPLAPPEQRWAEALARRGRLTRLEPTATEQPGEGDPYTGFVDTVFAGVSAPHAPAPLQDRAREFARRHPASPAHQRLCVYSGPNAEAEARAVDIQVRRWLLEGRRRIVIVSEDRKLARRVRALLERADVALRDASGWALSTSAAAAALERWLETIEEDFAYQPLTDLLKLPFAFPQRSRAERLEAVYRFEQDLVIHENIPRNLQRYRKHLAYRRKRLNDAVGTLVETLLKDIENAAMPLLPLVRAGQALSPGRWLEALEDSLGRLGMLEALAQDAAGNRILQELKVMRRALAGRTLTMRWREFRTWLGRTLERFNFLPPAPTAAVQLLGLEQSALMRCDGLIIAGATAQHLPGAGDASPFFNEGVRRELGLPGMQQRYATRFRLFRSLVQDAPAVLITAHSEEAGEPVLPSPWLEALQAFHLFAYQRLLDDGGLGTLVDDPAAQVLHDPHAPLPLAAARPAPAAPMLVPETLSAKSYQTLVDCPYQFFAARCLQLRAPDKVREALEKSDYGQRIHELLQAFHSGRPGYPPPFQQPITPANRAAAVARLEAISQAAFAKDLEDNFMHRGWLQRWRQVIPRYVDWQMAREAQWRVEATEREATTQLGGLTLTGRIDRLDRGSAGVALLDYKTGPAPTKDQVLKGEDVQLAFYALLAAEAPQRLEYLSLSPKKVDSPAIIEGDDLQGVVSGNLARLQEIMAALRSGAALPAWGDESACRRCDAAGICRRESWSEGPDAASA